MKRLLALMTFLAFLQATTLVSAQTADLPNIKQIKNHMAQETKAIDEGVKGKIISKPEAKKYRAKLAVIKKKLAGYMRKNGKKADLTQAQAKELFQMLHENNLAIQGGDLEKDEESAVKTLSNP